MRAWVSGLLVCALVGCQGSPSRNGSEQKPAVDVKTALERGQAAYAAGDWSAAEADYLVVVRAIPQDADHWFKLGNIYARTDRPDLAVAAYRETLVREPDRSKAWFNMGVVQLRQAANSFSTMEVHVADDEPVRRRAAKAYAAILSILNDGGGDEPTAGVPPSVTTADPSEEDPVSTLDTTANGQKRAPTSP